MNLREFKQGKHSRCSMIIFASRSSKILNPKSDKKKTGLECRGSVGGRNATRRRRGTRLPRIRGSPRDSNLRSAACRFWEVAFYTFRLPLTSPHTHLFLFSFDFKMGRLRRSRTHHAQRDVHRAARTRVRSLSFDRRLQTDCMRCIGTDTRLGSDSAYRLGSQGV